MKPKYSLLFTTCVALLSACSTARVHVLPGEKYNRVVSKDIEAEGAEEAAVKTATEYCKERGKEAIFANNQETKYNGTMDEQTRKNVRNASKAGMILGGAGGALGHGGAKTIGTVLGAGSTVGYAMTSDRDYKTEVEFYCR